MVFLHQKKNFERMFVERSSLSKERGNVTFPAEALRFAEAVSLKRHGW